jgi:DNA-binding NtrC family response regulator
VLKNLPLSGRTILIVEDAYLIALEAQRMVEEAGAAQVLLCSTVDDLRSLLAAEVPIDICILDLKLGQEDATPLIEVIASRGIVLLVATGLDTPRPDSEVPVLKKPYQENEFIDAIRRAIADKDRSIG